MKKCIIGKKVGMMQVFDETGIFIPVTVIEAGPCTVVQKKTEENDGYSAVKVGFLGEKAADEKEAAKGSLARKLEKNMGKPVKGQFGKFKLPLRKHLRELKLDNAADLNVGDEIKVDIFKAGEKVDVAGISKGKGFQGTIKRYGQKGGAETHGSMYHRRVGSMGANTSPARVFKGKKLPGHMGVDRITVLNLDVVRVEADKNLLLVRGAVPGAKGAILYIRNAIKQDA